jgi:hypothetical protein
MPNECWDHSSAAPCHGTAADSEGDVEAGGTAGRSWAARARALWRWVLSVWPWRPSSIFQASRRRARRSVAASQPGRRNGHLHRRRVRRPRLHHRHREGAPHHPLLRRHHPEAEWTQLPGRHPHHHLLRRVLVPSPIPHHRHPQLRAATRVATSRAHPVTRLSSSCGP